MTICGSWSNIPICTPCQAAVTARISAVPSLVGPGSRSGRVQSSKMIYFADFCRHHSWATWTMRFTMLHCESSKSATKQSLRSRQCCKSPRAPRRSEWQSWRRTASSFYSHSIVSLFSVQVAFFMIFMIFSCQMMPNAIQTTWRSKTKNMASMERFRRSRKKDISH